MDKLQIAKQTMEKVLAELGMSKGYDHWESVEPANMEDKIYHKGYNLFTLEAYERIANNLKEKGYTVRYENVENTHHTKVLHVKGDTSYPILHMKVTLDTSDECAKLKARLAELGCHY
jgi:hypothetical protein